MRQSALGSVTTQLISYFHRVTWMKCIVPSRTISVSDVDLGTAFKKIIIVLLLHKPTNSKQQTVIICFHSSYIINAVKYVTNNVSCSGFALKIKLRKPTIFTSATKLFVGNVFVKICFKNKKVFNEFYLENGTFWDSVRK